MDVKTGAKFNGMLTARSVRLYYEAGAYMQHCIGEAAFGAWTSSRPVPKNPNLLVESYAIYTNKVHFGCYRGYGCMQPAFATESQLDELSQTLNIDPVELRLMNAVDSGDCDITGQVMTNVALKQTIQAAAGTRRLEPSW